MVKNKYTGDALNILWKTKGRTFRKLIGGGGGAGGVQKKY